MDLAKHQTDGSQDFMAGAKPVWLIITIIAWVAFVVVGNIRYAPPAPLSAIEAGEHEFSAERADPILKRLVGDGIPHPAGSEHNKVVCQRIVELLQGWGYDVEQHHTHHGLWRQTDTEPIPLVNIIARLPGQVRGPAVMLVSHYDSRTGPGASDDGVGTAALLEIARMMKSFPQQRNDIIFLITDGEELGLLGADKFVQEHEWAQQVGVVINVEARGTTGPSLMFETSENSQWLVKLFADAVQRPMTSSLSYEIYKYLPNDTDFTIFRQAGMKGYNFAFIGDVKNYHTLDDNYENADRGSLQHHGENALALLRELAQMDIETTPSGNAVYFDVFGWFVVWWPEVWSIVLTVAAIVILLIVSTRRLRQSSTESWKDVPAAIGLVLGCELLAFFAVFGIAFLFSLDKRFEIPWPPSPVPIELAYWFFATGVVTLLVSSSQRFAKPTAVWCASSGYWLLFATLTSAYLAGASFLFVAPMFCVALTSLLCGFVERIPFQLVYLVFAVAVGFMWLPNERMFYDALGFKMNAALGVRVAIVLTALLPVLATSGQKHVRNFAWLNFAAFFVCAVASVFLNSSTVG